MISMIRAIARLCIIVPAVALAAVLLVISAPRAQAGADVVYISSTGIDTNPCTATQPCATVSAALVAVNAGGEILCVNSPGIVDFGFFSYVSFTLDCPGTFSPNASGAAIQLLGEPQVVTIRNLTIRGNFGGGPAIQVLGRGSLVLENCVLENFGTGAALDIEPQFSSSLVVVNSRISGSASGVLLKPASAGPGIEATFDHVRIVQNSGGGLKTDTTNGPVTVEITYSVVSGNGGNGINAVGGVGGHNMVSIKNSVVAKNSVAGLQSNGTNAGVLVGTTLLDQNASGATSVVGAGSLLTYDNNDIVGSLGSGFTGTAPLH